MNEAFGQIDIILGVDQTGAIKGKGVPKPLPACFLSYDSDQWVLHQVKAGLDRFDYISIEKILNKPLRELKVVIVADFVLGLPSEFESATTHPLDFLRDLFVLSNTSAGYGLKYGEEFFNEVLASINWSKSHLPKRHVEEQLGANSVFQPRPFQRNIQTGTFRIWRDLGSCEHLELFRFWPWSSEPEKGHPLVMEGYPSFAWRLINQSKRNTSLTAIRSKFANRILGLDRLNRFSSDELDAALLTFLFLELLSDRKIVPPKCVGLEGDILGSQAFT